MHVGKEFINACKLVTDFNAELSLLNQSSILSFYYNRKQHISKNDIWLFNDSVEIQDIILKNTGKHVFLDNIHVGEALKLNILLKNDEGKTIKLGFLIGINESWNPISFNHYLYLTDNGTEDECKKFSLILERSKPFTENDLIKFH